MSNTGQHINRMFPCKVIRNESTVSGCGYCDLFPGRNCLIQEILRLIIHREYAIDLVIFFFGEIGKKGVLALLCEYYFVMPGFNIFEKSVEKRWITFFPYKNTRIIIATFASNVDRVQDIINSADKFGFLGSCGNIR